MSVFEKYFALRRYQMRGLVNALAQMAGMIFQTRSSIPQFDCGIISKSKVERRRYSCESLQYNQ